MLKWIAELSPLASPRHQNSIDDDRRQLPDQDDSFMTDLVLQEVEANIIDFENQEEDRRNKIKEKTGIADYTWLISADCTQRPKKFLSIQERNKLTRACERIEKSEWAKTVNLFNTKMKLITPEDRTRESIIDCFVTSVHSTILERPRPVAISDVVRKYVRSGSSVNSVTDSPRPHQNNGSQSARSLADISFRSISDVV